VFTNNANSRLCVRSNQMQTTYRDGGPVGMGSTTPFAPPDIPPKLFTLPKVRARPPRTLYTGITPFQEAGQ
jgi:hypothetical protein